MEKKKLLDTQRQLLNIKKMDLRRADLELQATTNQIAIELGINPNELQNWRLDEKGEYLECFKKLKMKIPKEKK